MHEQQLEKKKSSLQELQELAGKPEKTDDQIKWKMGNSFVIIINQAIHKAYVDSVGQLVFNENKAIK